MMKKILVLSFLSVASGRHHTVNFSQTFTIVDSTVFELPFTAYEQPSTTLQLKDDTLYLLNYYGAEFYVLDKKGSVVYKIDFLKALAPRYNYSPTSFYLSKNYYVFHNSNMHLVFIDKSFRVGGYFWCNSFRDDYYSSYMLSTFFYSEKNKTAYLPCDYGVEDTDTIKTLTHDFYTKNIVAAFKIPKLISQDPATTKTDTNLLQKLINPQYLINHDDIYFSNRGFLPYLVYRAISLNDVRNEMIVGEAADSLLKVYDLNGNLLRTFGRKGTSIQSKDSLRFIRSFNRKEQLDKVFGFMMDSIGHRCASYGAIRQNPDLNLLARNYTVDDSSIIVSGKEVGYVGLRIWSNSTIRQTRHLQLYDHENLAGDFTIPPQWRFIGFKGKNLVFYKMFHVENSDRYTLHIYYVLPQI